MPVELHTRLADHPRLLPGVTAAGRVERVDLGAAGPARTLSAETLFAYLCVHGAASGWWRLKWLADVSALISRRDRSQLERWCAAAAALGAGRAASQAFLLADALLGAAVPPELLLRALQDRGAQRGAALAIRLMNRGGPAEPAKLRWGVQPLRLPHFLLGSGLRFKVEELRRQSVSPWDRAFGPLPGGARFLYPFARLPGWLWRVGRQAWTARSQ